MAELIAVHDVDLWNKIATGVFFFIFLVFTLWTYRPGAKTLYEKQGALPLDDAAHNKGPSHGR